MSRRHLRKVFGGNEIPPPDSDEEEEEIGGHSGQQSKFSGLEISSDSEKSDGNKQSESEDAEDQQVCVAAKPKKKKKNKKRKKVNQSQKQAQDEGEKEELDEIDKYVMEVNEMLGACAVEASTSEVKEKKDELNGLMRVHQRHLTPNREFIEKFGQDPEERDRNRGRQAAMDRLSRKLYLVRPKPFFLLLAKKGLSMSIYKREGGLTYFTYDHDSDYQKFHKRNRAEDIVKMDLMQGTHELTKHMYVEGMIQAVDTFFYQEVNSTAVEFLEMTVAYLQLCMHPSFVLYDPNVRLEYKIPENRPFFIAMLKHIHMLTNTACHRSALEMAKLLLNLEPSDPLAVILIIDTLALRAREHAWLIEAEEYWNSRNAGQLLNIQYSTAMAYFHVLTKNNESLERADELLREAILSFPTAAHHLMIMTSMRVDDSVKKHPLLTTFAQTTTTRVIKDLSLLYSKFSYQKWREPPVLKWFTSVLTKLIEDYGSDPKIEEKAKKLGTVRCNLFQEFPREIARHMMVIKPMAALLIDGEMPSSVPYGCPWNPLEDKSKTVHRYYPPPPPQETRSRDPAINQSSAMLLQWIESMAPAYRPRYPGETAEAALAAGMQHFFEAGAHLEQQNDHQWDVELPSDDEEE